MKEDDVILLAQNGDMCAADYIIKLHQPILRKKTHAFFFPGCEKDDVMQEGRIALYKAILDYCPEKNSNFRNFAEVCVTRHMITALKTATRKKHTVLNTAETINRNAFFSNSEEEGKQVADFLESNDLSPEEEFLNKERLGYAKVVVNEKLSGFEKNVLKSHIDGYNYQEIAKQEERSYKAVDNALQRIRIKTSTSTGIDK